jgi:hypothetical protein
MDGAVATQLVYLRGAVSRAGSCDPLTHMHTPSARKLSGASDSASLILYSTVIGGEATLEGGTDNCDL